MKPARCEEDMLRGLASMPFIDRLELAAVSGWSRVAVYEAVQRLEDEGLAASFPHAPDLIPPTRPLPPHRRRAAPAGAARGHDRGRSASQPPRLSPVAAHPA